MDRTLANGGLTRTVRFAVASDADEAGLRRLLRENPMPGRISVTFEREPDYFLGANLAGGIDQTMVAYEEERLVCMGRHTRRECWVNGEKREVGYLAELRLDRQARRRFAIVRDGYQFFRERCGGDEMLFTSIASENRRARRLLESGARGLPQYEFIGELVTLLIAVRPSSPRPSPPSEGGEGVQSPTSGAGSRCTPQRALPDSLDVAPATRADLPNVVKLLNEHGRRYQFATVWTEERLGDLAARGLPLERILLAKRDGKLVACGGVWDQRRFRQTVIGGYSGLLRRALPLVNRIQQALGRPRLPAPASALAQAFLSPLGFEEGAESLLPAFVEACFPCAAAAGVDWLTMSLPGNDVRATELRRRFHVRAWPSRLYRVRWPESVPIEDVLTPATSLPEVSLL